MKQIILALFLWIGIAYSAYSQRPDLPNTIFSGKQGKMHVQGVVVDQAHGFVYFSFTDKLIKMDLSGNLIGSVTGFVGHLGDLDITADGIIYGSLEYKNDAIGKGIKKELGVKTVLEDGFYIAMFDGSRIVRPDMNAEKEDLVRTVYIKEAVTDYIDSVKMGNKKIAHRFACSGIDGVAFAPSIGSAKDSKKFLYLAYGVYGDTTRNDNDYQVILKYDVSNWAKFGQRLSQDKLHHSGPEQPLEKYFVKTGNTRYGVQNLAYDEFSGNLYAAVYKGSKSIFPNYDLFVIDGKVSPKIAEIPSDNKLLKVKTLSLANSGKADHKSGVRGWNFEWGSTGLFPLGGGLFYISQNEKTQDGQQQATIRKYRWVGDSQNAFVLVN